MRRIFKAWRSLEDEDRKWLMVIAVFAAGIGLIGYAFGAGAVGICLLLSVRPLMGWVK